MRGRIGLNRIMDRNDGVFAVLGASIETPKKGNATPPEGLWLLADRHLSACLALPPRMVGRQILPK